MLKGLRTVSSSEIVSARLSQPQLLRQSLPLNNNNFFPSPPIYLFSANPFHLRHNQQYLTIIESRVKLLISFQVVNNKIGSPLERNTEVQPYEQLTLTKGFPRPPIALCAQTKFCDKTGGSTPDTSSFRQLFHRERLSETSWRHVLENRRLLRVSTIP